MQNPSSAQDPLSSEGVVDDSLVDQSPNSNPNSKSTLFGFEPTTILRVATTETQIKIEIKSSLKCSAVTEKAALLAMDNFLFYFVC